MAFRSRLRSHGGCASCKRRRKKCDEEKPVCGACRRHLLQCSWISPQQREHQITSTRHGNSDYEVIARYFQQRQTVPRGIDLSAYQGQICAAQTLELCFQGANIPFDPINTHKNGGSIQSTFSFAPIDDSLAWNCFVAFSLVVVGHRTQDYTLIEAGRLNHVKALNKIRSSIYDENKRYNLDTLAAISQLGITSIILPWFTAGNYRDSSDGIFHGAGLLIIFEKMQPQWFQTTHALAFFEHVRGGLLLLALTTQRETCLVSEAWKTIPWARAKHSKNEWHRLLDLFCELLAIESETRLGSRNQSLDPGIKAKRMQENVCSLLLRLRDWRQSIDFGLKSRLTTLDQATKLDHCSRSGLASWQAQRTLDLCNLANFNMILIYLCGFMAAGMPTSRMQTETTNNPTCSRPPEPPESPEKGELVLQLLPLILPVSDPLERAKVAARECFKVWDCAAKDGLYSIRILHLIGPLAVAEHFLGRVGEKVAVSSYELLKQMHVPRAGRS